MTNHYQTVLFIDLDGTIMKGPFDVVMPAALAKLAEEARLTLPDINRLIVEESQRRRQAAAMPLAQAMDWDDIMAKVAHDLRVSFPADLILQTVKAHAEPPHSLMLDDAATVLADLKTPERTVVAVTKGLLKYQQPILDGLGLTPLFDDIISPERNNVLKDDVQFYAAWRRRSRLQILVGDQYEDDVIWPQKFGIKTVWKPQGTLNIADPFERAEAFDNPEGETVKPTAIIFSLQELPPVINKIEQQFLQ